VNDYEKLGAFYLGRVFDPARGQPTPEVVLYDAKDLTTHAVCVGMTGSGKTGLCVSLVEEAAIDGIPVIAIDPKGDLGNLLLAFPELRADDFAPWIEPEEAVRKGRPIAELAEETAARWRRGLAEWQQDGARIARLRDAVDVTIYTPGARTGLPLSVLRTLAAPPAELARDTDAFAERVLASVSGLCALLGVDADPIRSREHMLLSNIVDHAWRAGRDLEIADLIRAIQAPPFDRIGVLDLESVFPHKDRFGLAMAFNGLLASPGFAAWMDGEPLDVARLLWTSGGRPRVSILSIAHLPEAQRMFFVTILLNEVVAWMRTQSGTSSLRALLYMDEVFGYLPPTANPPSKTPMLTLLKQARAFGVGCVLATQNPVDLDYKALSNAGTWFLGRLQTERDKARVLDGLEGASAAAGAAFDRARIDATLSGLQSRVFLMNNVHEDAPVLFHTRWALSFLRGPLSREQVRGLTAARPLAAPDSAARAEVSATHGAVAASARVDAAAGSERPVLPPGVADAFVPPRSEPGDGARLVYRPALLGLAQLHYVAAKDGVDVWQDQVAIAPIGTGIDANPWDDADAVVTDRAPAFEDGPRPGAGFAELPAEAQRAASYRDFAKRLAEHLYRSRPLALLRCPSLSALAKPGEREPEFRARLAHAARERRDAEIEALRTRFAPKLDRLQERIRAAEQRVQREQADVKQHTMSTVLSVGATLLGALFGRKVASRANIGRATSAIRGAGRVGRERGDVARAEESVDALRQQLGALEAEFQEAVAAAQTELAPAALELDTVEIAPRKGDLAVREVRLLWTPWAVGQGGAARPLAT
jgi:hypothetical protein